MVGKYPVITLCGSTRFKEQFLEAQKRLTLEDYMESGQWQKDFEADEAGLVPKDLPREVLSEDALYDLLSGADKIIAFAKESFAK